MELLTVAEMRELERSADAAGLSYADMMRRAGEAVAAEILYRLQPRSDPVRIVFLCGPGNNGGDGLVCAAALATGSAKRRIAVEVCLVRPRPDGDPLISALAAAGVPVNDVSADDGLRGLRVRLAQADVIVDALLGTGTTRAIVGTLRGVLHEMAIARERGRTARRVPALLGAQRVPAIVAVDGPTGMGYDTGSLDPAAVPADVTVTFHAAKRGHFCHPAAGALGELIVAQIGIERLSPSDARRRAALDMPHGVAVASDADIAGRLPRRAADANKGAHGRVLIVAGSPDYVGAPALCAAGALRAGSGLVVLAVPEASRVAMAALVPEAIYVAPTVSGLEKLVAISAALVGPGLGRGDSGRAALGAFLATLTHARDRLFGCVFDADALNLLAEDEALLEYRLGELPSIVTPHPGEMARLTGLPVSEIQADRIGHAIRFAREWRTTVVLKGANTVVASREGQAWIVASANPALASAGTGDVLAGAIVGLLGQGMQPVDAALCGVALHARAGEIWRAANGDAGLLASDLLTLLPQARRQVLAAAG